MDQERLFWDRMGRLFYHRPVYLFHEALCKKRRIPGYSFSANAKKHGPRNRHIKAMYREGIPRNRESFPLSV